MKRRLLPIILTLFIVSFTSCSKILELKHWGEDHHGVNLKWEKIEFTTTELSYPSFYSAYDDSKNSLYYVNKDGNILYEHNLKIRSIKEHKIENPIYRTVLISSRNGKLYGKSEFGRDAVFEYDFIQKKWINPTQGTGDYESFGRATYFNPIDKTIGFFGGYGYYKMKNFIWEVKPSAGQNWKLISPDKDNSASKGIARGVKNTTYNKSGSKLYIYGGQGNYSGNQFEQTCTSSITPMATGDGSYCWLRDLWEYDFKTRKLTNLISAFTDKLPLDGAMAYDEDRDKMFLMGGRKPPFSLPDHSDTEYNLTLYSTSIKSPIQFKEIKVKQTVLPQNESIKSLQISVLYYDHKLQMLVWVNSKGIFLLNTSKIK